MIVFVGLHGVFEEGSDGHEADAAGDGDLMPYTGYAMKNAGTEGCLDCCTAH